jgi:hypothetical protein
MSLAKNSLKISLADLSDNWRVPTTPSSSPVQKKNIWSNSKQRTFPKEDTRTFGKDLWVTPDGWLSNYHCPCCSVLMSKRDAVKRPQKIVSCGHVVCANCIVTSYFVNLNTVCPIKGCGVCVNPTDSPSSVEGFTG